MENQDYTTTFLAAATSQQVFDAVNNVRSWWSENIEGITDEPGSEFIYHYQDVHICKIKITEFVPGKLVAWHMQDNYFKFTKNSHELKGSDILFEISEKNNTTQLTFTHKGLIPECECYQVCQDAWTYYIQESLKNLIETGKGNATPKDAGEATQNGHLTDSKKQVAAFGIHHRLLIEKPAEIVYEALTTQKGLAGWWTPETVAQPEVGSISRFNFSPNYFKE